MPDFVNCNPRDDVDATGRLRPVWSNVIFWTHVPTHSMANGWYNHVILGAVAQLGERLNGIQEVRGSTPLGSTTIHDREMSRADR